MAATVFGINVNKEENAVPSLQKNYITLLIDIKLKLF